MQGENCRGGLVAKARQKPTAAADAPTSIGEVVLRSSAMVAHLLRNLFSSGGVRGRAFCLLQRRVRAFGGLNRGARVGATCHY